MNKAFIVACYGFVTGMFIPTPVGILMFYLGGIGVFVMQNELLFYE